MGKTARMTKAEFVANTIKRLIEEDRLRGIQLLVRETIDSEFEKTLAELGIGYSNKTFSGTLL